MNDIPCLSVTEAQVFYSDKSAVFIDVRDPASYKNGHIPGALHVNDHNIDDFVNSADKTKHHIIYCYHGNASQGGTAYFLEQGFESVHSLDGGFAHWALLCPTETESSP